MMKKNFPKILAGCTAMVLMTGTLLVPSMAVNASAYQAVPQLQQASYIGEAKAKEIALSHAGADASKVSWIFVKQDYDHGRVEYDVEFLIGNKEYDYEIDAVSGAVVQYDHDAEYYKPQQSDNGTLITESKASQIALDRVSGASENNLRIKLDYDDGRPVYEGEIFYNSMEYEFEIDGYTGTVLEWSAESIYD